MTRISSTVQPNMQNVVGSKIKPIATELNSLLYRCTSSRGMEQSMALPQLVAAEEPVSLSYVVDVRALIHMCKASRKMSRPETSSLIVSIAQRPSSKRTTQNREQFFPSHRADFFNAPHRGDLPSTYKFEDLHFENWTGTSLTNEREFTSKIVEMNSDNSAAISCRSGVQFGRQLHKYSLCRI